MQGVAPPEALRRVSLEIDFSGLRGGAISTLTVDHGCLGGSETRIRARKGSGLAEISLFKGSLLLSIEEGLLGDRLLRLARRSDFGPSPGWLSIKGVCADCAVQKHESAWGKVLLMLKYQYCKAE